jgi:hypothetical protein
MQPVSIGQSALLALGTRTPSCALMREARKVGACSRTLCGRGRPRSQQLTRFIKAQTRISLLNHATAFQRAKLFRQIVLAMVLDNYQAVFP